MQIYYVCPKIIKKNIIPMLQISLLAVYGTFSNNYGAMNNGVPTHSFNNALPVKSASQANPKSAIL